MRRWKLLRTDRTFREELLLSLLPITGLLFAYAVQGWWWILLFIPLAPVSAWLRTRGKKQSVK